MRAIAVVDLGFGDAGKGITTDYLCEQYPEAVVVRFSGGQQAGHQVQIDDQSHIHSNYGAGTLRGLPSYFSEHTTFYPVTMYREYEKFDAINIIPKISFHPLARITTPYDVVENRRCADNLEHGTCGLGVGKTHKRNSDNYTLYAVDLFDLDTVKLKMEAIQSYYKVEQANKWLREELGRFYEALHYFRWEVYDYEHLNSFKNIIFEGSQGILLDKDHGVFPHVTYSNTTSKNAVEIMDKLNIPISERMICYVTRLYSTRHGAGPYTEQPLELINNGSETNKFNVYQKEFKVAPIDYDKLNYALSIDAIYSRGCNTALMVTCCDQLPDVKFQYDLLKVKFDTVLESYSPDCKDVKIIKGS